MFSDAELEKCGEFTNMIEVKIDLELVESLLAETSTYTGTVLLCELKDSMETYIKNGLLRGCSVTVRKAFDHAWSELVVEDAVSSDEDYTTE